MTRDKNAAGRAEPVAGAVTDSLDELGVLRPEHPLYRDVDLDALERLHAHATARESSVVVTFEYDGLPVRVRLGQQSDVAVDAPAGASSRESPVE